MYNPALDDLLTLINIAFKTINRHCLSQGVYLLQK
jgi:hypothetical protein